MKYRQGFTIVELMVVIAIGMLLLSYGIPAISTWKQRLDVEAQVSRLFEDINHVRVQAYSQKTVWRLWWGASPFTIYQIQRDGVRVRSSPTLAFPVQGVGASLAFNARGFTNNNMTLRVLANVGASYDCIVVSNIRVIKGRWDGGSCVLR